MEEPRGDQRDAPASGTSASGIGASGIGAPASVRRRGRVLLWQWPLVVALLGVGASLVVVVVDGFRPGAIGIGASVLLAGVVRLVLPDRLAGLLVLRGRAWDVLTLLFLGAAILALALVVPEIR